MTESGSVIPALLLTAAVTALAAGFAAFAPVAEVTVTPHEQIAPQDRAPVHIDFFTEKRDAPVEGVDILLLDPALRTRGLRYRGYPG
ncbi:MULTISPECIES: hypothetical protein [Methanoculleus]|uniref:Uncharacterized protein n=2 Tax=Methanoculleus TaxID=45989 RepID=A3CRN9_METMJ|nr:MULTISPECIES: hypothetical protein [Methanoculleus]ABN56039.1 hypothetical protein Memar_0104 [Methanoculleus marisnigri JR1]UYU17518.1 hypothetical protein OH143_07310 [Methanoculleus submarinus]